MINLNDDRALKSYMSDISKYQTLTREHEYELAKEMLNGDKQAKETLINSNLKFVVRVAIKYQNRGLSLSELISEGNLGLIKAIEKFDPERGIKLISYAVWWIKHKILIALAEKTNVVKIPLSINTTLTKERIKNAKSRQKQVIDTDNEMSYVMYNDTAYSDISIDEKFNEFLLNECMKSEITDPVTLLYKERLLNTINKSIQSLEPREAFILKSYFGLDGYPEKNFVEIASGFDITRERVRQLQKKALQKIKANVNNDKWHEIDYLLSNFN